MIAKLISLLANIFNPVTLVLLAIATSFAAGYWIGNDQDTYSTAPVEHRLWPDVFSEIPDQPAEPETRYIKQTDTVETVRVDTVRVPVDYERYRLTSERPITVDSREVHLRYYDPERQRHEVERFEVPEPRWRSDLSVGLSVWHPVPETRSSASLHYMLDLRGSIRYRRVEGHLSAGVWYWQDVQPFVGGGVRVEF